MATDLELAWAAGFFDGEGCIYLRAGKGIAGWQLLCSLGQSDDSPLEEFQRIVGGVGFVGRRHYPKRSNRRPCWAWQTSSQKAEDVLRLLLPFLRVKRSQAVAALEFQETYPEKPYGYGNPIPSEVVEERGRLAKKVKALKLVGMEEEEVA